MIKHELAINGRKRLSVSLPFHGPLVFFASHPLFRFGIELLGGFRIGFF